MYLIKWQVCRPLTPQQFYSLSLSLYLQSRCLSLGRCLREKRRLHYPKEFQNYLQPLQLQNCPREKTPICIKKNCLIWKRESVSSRPLYLWSAAWSCSVFAALCTSTPTELQRRVRAQNINSEWEGGTKTTVEVFGLTAAEGKWKQLLCCLMTG